MPTKADAATVGEGRENGSLNNRDWRGRGPEITLAGLRQRFFFSPVTDNTLTRLLVQQLAPEPSGVASLRCRSGARCDCRTCFLLTEKY